MLQLEPRYFAQFGIVMADPEDDDDTKPKAPEDLLKMELEMKEEDMDMMDNVRRENNGDPNDVPEIKEEPDDDTLDDIDDDEEEEDADYEPERRTWKYASASELSKLMGKKEKKKYKKRKGQPTICDLCDKTFAKPAGLEKHNIVHHPERLPPCDLEAHPCDMCDKVFPVKEYLRFHKKYTHAGKEEKCDVCDFSPLQYVYW